MDTKLVQATITMNCVPNLRNLFIKQHLQNIISYKNSTTIIHEHHTYNDATAKEILAYLLLLDTSLSTDEMKVQTLLWGPGQ